MLSVQRLSLKVRFSARLCSRSDAFIATLLIIFCMVFRAHAYLKLHLLHTPILYQNEQVSSRGRSHRLGLKDKYRATLCSPTILSLQQLCNQWQQDRGMKLCFQRPLLWYQKSAWHFSPCQCICLLTVFTLLGLNVGRRLHMKRCC